MADEEYERFMGRKLDPFEVLDVKANLKALLDRETLFRRQVAKTSVPQKRVDSEGRGDRRES